MGTLRMASDLSLLPRREFRIEVFEHLCRLGFEAGNLLADGGCTVSALERAQFRHLGLELGHRLFEIEIAAHRVALSGTPRRRPASAFLACHSARIPRQCRPAVPWP